MLQRRAAEIVSEHRKALSYARENLDSKNKDIREYSRSFLGYNEFIVLCCLPIKEAKDEYYPIDRDARQKAQIAYDAEYKRIMDEAISQL